MMSSPASYILAADTVVAVGRRILPKADLLDEAAQCLRLLSGRKPPRSHRRLSGDARRRHSASG
jgi:predicted house-cleaning NTP pyrophosphatase (Maf/HAM1 superfamily)